MEEEGVVLRLELEVVALHGLLLYCRAHRELEGGEEGMTRGGGRG